MEKSHKTQLKYGIHFQIIIVSSLLHRDPMSTTIFSLYGGAEASVNVYMNILDRSTQVILIDCLNISIYISEILKFNVWG